MIYLQNLAKTFAKGSANEVRALDNVSLQIAQGEYVVLVGANGSGKSSLLNAIAGSFWLDSGSIKFGEVEVSQLPDYQRSKWIARIFQNPLSGTAPDLSILDNFRLAALRTQKKGFGIGINRHFRQKVQEKIALLQMGLENKIDQAMGSLSGGQRQALTLIMAIMDNAQILLMDEPTAALDPKSAHNVMQKAAQISQEFRLTTVLVTHDLKDAHQYGSRVIQMQNGKVIRDLDFEQKKQLSRADLLDWF
ncbi:MAG: ATP-binding cassette domain-containing protein [Microscillaceae bacterium]|jgi:putative ABC transport system ATP-binding protein|nr:ATP-binding cassette domain-containing protein [Microscillaceae bacterium]